LRLTRSADRLAQPSATVRRTVPDSAFRGAARPIRPRRGGEARPGPLPGAGRPMTSDSSRDMGSPEKVERLYAGFLGDAHPVGEPPEGFGEWVRNLHDVYLNVETAWLASRTFRRPMSSPSLRTSVARVDSDWLDFSRGTCGCSGRHGIGGRSTTMRSVSAPRARSGTSASWRHRARQGAVQAGSQHPRLHEPPRQARVHRPWSRGASRRGDCVDARPPSRLLRAPARGDGHPAAAMGVQRSPGHRAAQLDHP